MIFAQNNKPKLEVGDLEQLHFFMIMVATGFYKNGKPQGEWFSIVMVK
jgi:hypothetical protein